MWGPDFQLVKLPNLLQVDPTISRRWLWNVTTALTELVLCQTCVGKTDAALTVDSFTQAVQAMSKLSKAKVGPMLEADLRAMTDISETTGNCALPCMMQPCSFSHSATILPRL